MGRQDQQAMSSSTVTVRPRKLMTNRLLSRRQMILDIIHPNTPTPDKATLRKLISDHLSKQKHAKAEAAATSIFGMRTDYGGGKSTAFCLVYDSVEKAKEMEPKHRLIRMGLAGTVTRTTLSTSPTQDIFSMTVTDNACLVIK